MSLVSSRHPVHPEIKKMREIWNISFFFFQREQGGSQQGVFKYSYSARIFVCSITFFI